ncbi:NmrA family NAD(P)-binding protein [Luteipulveratus flavus]|uniref:NmrA family NAD(P)-binding protein n=1 Tax=Luteipulveratus flavus TaxID=3031728 RepID=A0ABT6C4P0_9MICO|nr:NmrA family NAD(P)-binding protein [Luteipulveratus sp. YIM 133296]MDF8263710.1 NmrA family NAD(P)-binding protein [Luteipulveratus sp. YIM 133296]
MTTTTTAATGTIALTCPRGKTGRDVLAALTAHGAPVRPVGRSERTPFDWTDPDTWRPAVAGARAAYLVYQPDLAMPGSDEAIARLARIAAGEGVEHLVLLSGRNEPGAQAAEQALRESGLAWTLVTSSFFAQNFTEGLWHQAVLEGRITIPSPDVPEPFVDTADVAAVVTAALLDERHRDRQYEVSGPAALTFADAAERISAATGRPVEAEQVSPEVFVIGLVRLGLPREDADGLAWLFEQILDGRNSAPVDGVRQALGRPARSFDDVVADAAAQGVWARS